MSELSRDEVVEILGPVGDAMAAEIIATGISKEGLVAAHDRVVRDRKAHKPGPRLEPGPFAQVVESVNAGVAGGFRAGSTNNSQIRSAVRVT